MLEALFRSIAYNLRRLADFSGRERQILFWPYAGFVYGLATLISTALTLAPIVNMFMEMMRDINEASRRGGYAQPDFLTAPDALTPDFSGLVVPIALINALAVLLLAAAAARRLHDKDLSAWWALLPLPSMMVGIVLMPSTMPNFAYAGAKPDPQLYWGMLNGMLNMILLIGLVILLIGEGTKGPNRFGAEPA